MDSLLYNTHTALQGTGNKGQDRDCIGQSSQIPSFLAEVEKYDRENTMVSSVSLDKKRTVIFRETIRHIILTCSAYLNGIHFILQIEKFEFHN